MTIHVEVTPRGNEPIEKLLRRFTRKCKKEELTREMFDRMFFKSPKQKRKEKQARRKRLMQKRKRNR